MTCMNNPTTIADKITIHHGDCYEKLFAMPHNHVDAIVTDPPYGISFMGKAWDCNVPSVDIWKECLRVLKPGGHLLCFAGTRTQHRMCCNIEDAGFEIRDMIAWVYGSGFPKSLNVSKAIDKAAGVEREVVEKRTDGSGASPQKLLNHGKGDTGIGYLDGSGKTYNVTVPATEAAKQWDGWGTALKPSHEPLTLAQKPLTIVPCSDIVQAESNIGGLICLSLSHAKHAESLLRSSPSECDGVAGSALLIAAVHRGLSSGESSETMAMFKSPETARTILSIVESWSSILAAVSERQSKFTMSTAISLTTALRTFNCLTSETIRGAITPDGEQALGRFMSAPIAVESSSGASAKPAGPTSVQGLVLWLTEPSVASIAESSFMPAAKAGSSVLRDAITSTAESISPAFEPITVARKPFKGTVANNVLMHGTGAINIDGCRVTALDGVPKFTHRKESAVNCYGNGKAGSNRTGEMDVATGRFPANLILTYPEDSYTLRDDVTPEQLRTLAEWIDENPQL